MATVRELPLYEWGASYDSRYDLIRGCTPGSKTWHHEKRHQWQYKTFERFFTGLDIITGFAAMVAVWALLKGDLQLIVYSVAVMLPHALRMVAVEVDAELYSWRQWIKDLPVKKGKEEEL